jgi:UDP:flavonoid glycosyltransferase YjiC (YdhE family)
MPHVVFAWEIGSGLGHLTPIAALGEAFRRRGHRVTAIVPNVERSRRLLAPLGIEVVELPLHPAPPRAFPISINYTANLLRNGFWHGPTVASRVETWRALLNRLEPDFLICDHAPGALLASRDAEYPRAAMGTGFTLPPLSTPMPSVQPWFRIPADRLADSDRAFLGTVNPVLTQAGLPALPTVASLFDGLERFLHVEPELDHYPVRPDETYLGAIEPAQSLSLPELPPESDGGVFVYLSATNRFLEPVLDALKARNVRVDAYIAGKTSAPGTSIQAPNIHYLQSQVDLRRVAVRCRLAITHGGTLSASMLLGRGARLLVCPEDLEKAVFGQRLLDRKLAYSFNWFASDAEDATAILGNVLDSIHLPSGLAAFVASQAGRRNGDNVDATVARGEGQMEFALSGRRHD